ncbi:hypothetical protein W97_08401 [Coniosporium apollinis CBS 100218]|uniref:Uncharacterized protein n=1 Tax=Coniosporium apollinis (strain CBS 100218) TaxID=1168221 RepID=R7Z4T2_CONA1|nr:uncharacterized protein W97_08401 [Coniosporium apollinis CBS 100218]EON69088.1 hypothetical protein W97_08401 [Coniosporium apollinis CBS 100218]
MLASITQFALLLQDLAVAALDTIRDLLTATSSVAGNMWNTALNRAAVEFPTTAFIPGMFLGYADAIVAFTIKLELVLRLVLDEPTAKFAMFLIYTALMFNLYLLARGTYNIETTTLKTICTIIHGLFLAVCLVYTMIRRGLWLIF